MFWINGAYNPKAGGRAATKADIYLPGLKDKKGNTANNTCARQFIYREVKVGKKVHERSLKSMINQPPVLRWCLQIEELKAQVAAVKSWAAKS